MITIIIGIIIDLAKNFYSYFTAIFGVFSSFLKRVSYNYLENIKSPLKYHIYSIYFLENG